MPRAVARFEVERVDEEPPYVEDGPVRYVHTQMGKTFTGEIEGESVVEMLSVRSDGSGAGYVALERVEASVLGRRGSFALLHVGTMSLGAQWGRWPVVSGSGTGELVGISGEARIDIAPDGAHTLQLDFELG
jgi:hypothetical protein